MQEEDQSKASGHVPLKSKIGWGLGGLADNYIMNSVLQLTMPIYNIALGMDPVRLGIALMVPRFFDAITDPLMGNISDNTRSRWGRRRPYIALGAILTAVLLPLLWMPPRTTETFMFWYFMIVGTLYFLMYTVFIVPYTALGYELTNDYDERTRVLAYRMYVGLLGSLTVPWLYKLCLSPIFDGDVVLGARWVSVAMGLVIIVTGIIPVIYCREPKDVQKQKKIKLLDALFATFQNKPFLVLLISYIIIICGLFTSATLGLYINIYYVCDGDKNFAATIMGYSGSMTAAMSYLSLFLITWVSVRKGKRHAMILGLILSLVGIASLWFTMTPKYPYLQLASTFIAGLGMQGCWLMIQSMVADICDEDELKTGLRREGVYGAVTGFALKISLAITALTGGILLKMSGYDAKSAEEAGAVAVDVALKMKTLFVSIQCVALFLTIIMFCYYPITRARAAETRRILDERHQGKL